MRYYELAFNRRRDRLGRSGRKEFWGFVVVDVILLSVLSFLDALLGLYPYKHLQSKYGFLVLIYVALTFRTRWNLYGRRLHDVNKSEGWIWATNLPIVGFYVLYLYAKRGTVGENKYGAPSRMQQKRDGLIKQADTDAAEITYRVQYAKIPAPNGEQKPARFCRKCGLELPAGSGFCYKCGTAVIK